MIIGLDTSRWEDSPTDPRTVDWQMAKANDIKFVIMKATEGTILKDTIYPTHKAALNGLLPRGSYHYLRTQSAPADQAKFYFDYAGKLELPPVLDVEDFYHELPKGEQLYTLIMKTMGYIDQYFGQKTMLYTSPNIIRYYLGLEWAQKLTDRKLWIAHYGVMTPDIGPWQKYTFWQYAETGDAHKYGIPESSSVDMNYYRGSVDEFNQEFNLSDLNQGPIEVNMSNSNKAHGIELNEFTGKVDITQFKDIAFGIVHGGAGWSAPFDNLKDNVQYLYNANLPCILLWDILIPGDYNASDLAKTFPPQADDPNVLGIKRALSNKAIAGVIIRFLDKDTPEGIVFVQGWMANLIKYMVDAVFKQTGNLLYVMTSQGFIDSFGTAQACPQLNQEVSGIDGMCSWKSAFPGQSTQTASWDNLPIPADTYSPEYISNNTKLYFINYARTAWRLPGIMDTAGNVAATPLWQYKGTPAELKADLGYKDHAINTTPEPTPTPTNGKKYTLVSEMNIRTGPGVGYPKAGTLPARSEVEALDVAGSNAWIEIADGHWICASLNGTDFLK